MQLTAEFKTEFVEQSFEILPPGIYSFSVTAALVHTSKTGNPSIKVQLLFSDPANPLKTSTVFDYLTANPAWKLRSFLRSVGLTHLEEQPVLQPFDLVNATGQAKIKVEKSEQYNDKNTIQSYKVANAPMNASVPNTPPQDVPF